MSKKIIGASIGHCVHVAGILSFLRIAESCGYQCNFLGTGLDFQEIIGVLHEDDPDYLALSYRLTPEVAKQLFQDLKSALVEAGLSHKQLLFGGTPPVARAAEASGIFFRVFSGEEEEREIAAFLKGEERTGSDASPRPSIGAGDSLVKRIEENRPFPIIRHHFGLPTLEETLQGLKKLATSKALDVISIGPDQNAQESFFRPQEMDSAQDGAGGVPLRCEEDLKALYAATRTGNYPLLRIYSGTRDLLAWGRLAVRTINNAWAAIPLFWYNRLDGRSDRPLAEGIKENQSVMAWYAKQGLPVEVNEAHHWSLRGGPDSVAVAAFYLAAYNAKQAGVQDYVAQIMLNNPPGTSGVMDIGKSLAELEMIERLAGSDFRIHRQIRAGLASLAVKPHVAKGQLAASTLLGLSLKPEIIHVVAFCEADHAATPEDIIESCGLVQGVLKNALFDFPDLTTDPRALARRDELIIEAEYLLESLTRLGKGKQTDPYADPQVLAAAVHSGLLDAPQLKGNPEGRGLIKTGLKDGACRILSADGKKVLSEKQRIEDLMQV